MQGDALQGNLKEAQDAGERQGDHKQLDPGGELVGGLAQMPAVGEGADDGVVDGVPQTGDQEQTGHPHGVDAQTVGAEGQKVCVHIQVDEAAGHVTEDIAPGVLCTERTNGFVDSCQFDSLLMVFLMEGISIFCIILTDNLRKCNHLLLCDEITESRRKIGYPIDTKKHKGGHEYVCCQHRSSQFSGRGPELR